LDQTCSVLFRKSIHLLACGSEYRLHNSTLKFSSMKSNPSTQNETVPFELIDNVRHYNFKQSCQYLQELGKQQYGAKFKLHNSDKEILYKLLIYAIRDKENCAKHGIDLNKGILLNGPVGCGKTSLMKLLRSFQYKNFDYAVISSRDIAHAYNQDGFAIIHKYGRSQRIYCFDDLGVEQTIKHFGNECNTMGEILLNRYDLMVNYGIVTHATTNLDANKLEAVYGNRVRSRLREMFNLVGFGRETMDKRK